MGQPVLSRPVVIDVCVEATPSVRQKGLSGQTTIVSIIYFCMETTSYALSFRMAFLYLVNHGLDFLHQLMWEINQLKINKNKSNAETPFEQMSKLRNARFQILKRKL